MIAFAGMSDKLLNLCYYHNDEYAFNKPYSEHTAEIIDQEVQKMINEQYARAKELLQQHREGHAQLAQMLIEREVIFCRRRGKNIRQTALDFPLGRNHGRGA